MRTLKYLLLAFLLLSFGCKKEEAEVEFKITLKNTTPTNLQEFQENIIVTLEYQHPEGFLGFEDPDYLRWRESINNSLEDKRIKRIKNIIFSFNRNS